MFRARGHFYYDASAITFAPLRSSRRPAAGGIGSGDTTPDGSCADETRPMTRHPSRLLSTRHATPQAGYNALLLLRQQMSSRKQEHEEEELEESRPAVPRLREKKQLHSTLVVVLMWLSKVTEIFGCFWRCATRL
jgi:hypothetical protein